MSARHVYRMPRRTRRAPTQDRRLSVLFSSTSKSFTVPSVHDRNTLNSFPFKRLRTAFFATAGWGGSTIAPLHSHPRNSAKSAACCSLSSNSLRITSLADPHTLTPVESHPYQKRRGGGIRRSYKNSKTLPGFSARPNFQSLTNCSLLSPLFGFLCFHALTHCPICNPFVLMALQPYRGGGIALYPERREGPIQEGTNFLLVQNATG